MARVLVSLDELANVVAGCATFDLDGQPHLDGDQLFRSVATLTGNQPARLMVPPVGLLQVDITQPGPSGPESIFAGAVERAAAAGALVEPADDPLRAERERLAALPPGKCVGCKHIHPDGPCNMGALGSATCPCDDYVDSTVRDPVQVALDSRPFGIAPNAEPIAQLPHVEPQINPVTRPASNDNAFRPPTGPS